MTASSATRRAGRSRRPAGGTTRAEARHRRAAGRRYAVPYDLEGPKVGLGLEYKFTEALAMRGEYERYRMDDGIRSNANVDMISLGLVYKLGRPAAAPVVYTPPPAPAPVAEAPPAPAAWPGGRARRSRSSSACRRGARAR